MPGCQHIIKDALKPAEVESGSSKCWHGMERHDSSQVETLCFLKTTATMFDTSRSEQMRQLMPHLQQWSDLEV